MNLDIAADLFELHESAAAEPTNRLLLEKLDLYRTAVNQIGYKIPKCSRPGLEALSTLSEAKKKSITAQVELWASWIEQDQKAKSTINDIDMLETALSHYGLEMDDEMRASIDQDTVVEVYSEDMIQIYRSFKMLLMTSYSLLDLCVHEWFVLWERPQLTIQNMHADVQQILQTELGCQRMTVAPHIVKENLDTGLTEPFHPRSSLVKFQNIGFLKQLRADSPRAFICTAKGSIVSENPLEVGQLAFL